MGGGNQKYIFLPAGANINNCRFIGIDDNITLTLAGVEYNNNQKWGTDLTIDNIYEYRLVSKDSTYEEKGTLQVLQSKNLGTFFIETETGSLETIHQNKENKEEGTLLFLDESGKRKYYGQLEYITGRGNSTWAQANKKSYQIKLVSPYGFFDMESAQKWILMSNALDASYMRNYLVYNFAFSLGMPTTQCEYIDVFINGKYVGNYLVMEKIEIGNGRLELTNLELYTEKLNSATLTNYISEDGTVKAKVGGVNPPDITGGYIIELDTHTQFELAESAFITQRGTVYIVKSPENATLEQVLYLQELFDEIEETIYAIDGVNAKTQKSLGEYVDLDSWANRFLIDEVFLEYDAGMTSTFFYKDSDSKDSLVYAGPVWDYDKSMGNYMAQAALWLDAPQNSTQVGAYCQALRANSEFYALAMDKYESIFKPALEHIVEVELDQWKEYISYSVNMDEVLEGGVNRYYESLEANVDFLKIFLTERLSYLDEVWLEGVQYNTVSFYNTWTDSYIDQYPIKHGEYLTYIPYVGNYEAIFNGWTIEDTGYLLNIRKPILEPVTFHTQWIPANIFVENGVAMSNNLSGVGEVEE